MGSEISKELKVVNDLGFHARAAAQIAKLAQNARGNVWLVKDEEKVDAASIIDILTLACAKGMVISILVEDPADEKVLDDIVKLVEDGFGE